MYLCKRTGFLFKRFTSLKFNQDDLLNIIACIDVKSNNPFDLYKDWFENAPNSVSKSFWSLANYSKRDNRVHNRYIQLFNINEYEKDRFVFLTDKRTEKCKDFISCPNVSLSTIWQYKDIDLNVKILRQIRADGKIKQCSSEDCLKVFDKFSLSARIKWHLCEQNKKLHSWSILQYAFESVIKEIKNDITQRSSDIIMPRHMVAYEIEIDKMYFFHSILGQKNKFVPDRVVFEKMVGKKNIWNHAHITS